MPNNIKEKKVSESKSIMTEIVMPNDTNPLGNLMGGNLMRWMDIAASITAGRHCEAHVVTASVDNVSFTLPIPLGAVVTLEAVVTRAFNTSVEIYVQVYIADIKGHKNKRSNHAYFTFVALDEKSLQPVPVPPLLPLSQEEIFMYEGAERRRELRLVLSGRIKAKQAVHLKEYLNND